MKQHSILIVEGDTAFARTLAQALRLGLEVSYDVSICGSAKEAYRSLDANQYDLLISDYSLPDEGGPSLVTKAREQTPEMLAVLIAEGETQGEECRARSLIQGCLVKPFDMLDLLLMVQQVLKAAGMDTEGGQHAAPDAQSSHYAVLILEDDAGLRTIYSRALRKSRCYQIDEAATLDEARNLLNTRDYDILISDMRIGRDRATDILAEFAEKLQLHGTKVVMCSAFGQYRNLPAKVDHFLEKPISLDSLVNLVGQLAEIRPDGSC